MIQNTESAVIDDGHTDRRTVVRLLNGALASEISCVLRYQRHHFLARRIDAQAVARELLAYAYEEQHHADLIAARITQLGGPLVFSPEGLLTLGDCAYSERKDLIEMIREDLVAERIGIATYAGMIRYFEDVDPASRRLLEEILVTEEEHAGDLTALIDILQCEEREAAFAARDPRDVHHQDPRRSTPGHRLTLIADRPRRVDTWIDYFGAGPGFTV